jgi:hypothetical protein
MASIFAPHSFEGYISLFLWYDNLQDDRIERGPGNMHSLHVKDSRILHYTSKVPGLTMWGPEDLIFFKY